MTPDQCRTMRALIDQTWLCDAEAAALGLSTVVDFERSRRQVSAEAVARMRDTLEAADVEFLGAEGVRFTY